MQSSYSPYDSNYGHEVTSSYPSNYTDAHVVQATPSSPHQYDTILFLRNQLSEKDIEIMQVLQLSFNDALSHSSPDCI